MTDTTDDGETVLVVNPQSGSGDHAPTVHDRATLLGYTVLETERENHALELARRAATDGAACVAAVGGDGTLNEVVRGVWNADALADVTVAVVPAGTGNDFASNVGIAGLDDGFRALESGERRWLDLGLADDTPFVNSCLAGIVAEASDETSSALKSQFGPVAYLLKSLQLANEYGGISLTATVVEGDDRERVWEGQAMVVLVGNGRRFSLSGSGQADVEDGLLDVTIVEEIGSLDLVEERLRERLLEDSGEHITRLLVSSLDLSVDETNPVRFSFDGEITDARSVRLSTRRRAVRMPVGDGYDPTPDP